MITANQLGLKLWSHDCEMLQLAKQRYQEKRYGYIELYIVPGTFVEYSQQWKMLDIPYIIHASHDAHGFNLAENCLEQQLLQFSESQRFADLLHAPLIILHPGHGNLSTTNLESFILKVNEPRLCLENMPALALDHSSRCQLSHPHEMKSMLALFPVLFCLDVGHAIAAANFWKINLFDMIREFCLLCPSIIHLSDGWSQDLCDAHLSIGAGDYPYMEIIPRVTGPQNRLFTLETPKETHKNLQDFLQDCSQVIDFSR